MGEVYLAEDTRLDRKVALKFLPQYLQQDEVAQKRFVREAKSAAAIDHPYICKIYEPGETEDYSFIAMEYVEGETLQKRMDQGPLALKETLHIASEMAEALEEAHKKGIVHRDLKPANVMLTSGGHIKVMDFGLAKRLQPRGKEEEITAALTREGTTLGTLTYMSPEQLKGKQVDTRSDIFSFGVMLYEMLTGVHPFRTGTQAETINSILNEHPSTISRYTEDTSDILEHTVEKMLAKDPATRYQSVHEVWSNLRKLQEKLSYSGVLSADLHPSPRKTPWFWWAIGAVAVVLVSAVSYQFLPRLSIRDNRVPSSGPIQHPLTTLPGREVHPALSPNGKQVVFAHQPADRSGLHLYLKNVGEPGELQLTEAKTIDTNPTWHPDGSKIAFQRSYWSEERGRKPEIWTTTTLKGPEKLIYRYEVAGGVAEGLSYSPDGKYLAYSEPRGIYLFSTVTGERRQFTKPEPIEGEPTTDLWPTFSPNGAKIAFVRRVGRHHKGIACVQAIERDEPIEVAHSERIYQVAWAVEGDSIISVEGTTPTNTYLVRTYLDGSPGGRLSFGGRARGISISGERLAFTMWLTDLNIWRTWGPKAENEAKAEEIIASTRGDSNPQFSPDGKRIAFESDRTAGTSQIYVSDVHGRDTVPLTAMEGVGRPKWSPGADQILFAGRSEKARVSTSGFNEARLWLIDAEGGVPKKLNLELSSLGDFGWSADGESIYFTNLSEGVYQIWKTSLESGETIKLTHSDGGKRYPTEWNGRLYFGRGQQICSMPADGGDEKEEFEGIPSDFCLWDGHIVWRSKDGEGGDVLKLFNLETGARFQRPISMPGYRNAGTPFSVSPDGRWIVYTHRNQMGSDLMLVENFR
jgi:serine/threonine protein kinase